MNGWLNNKENENDTIYQVFLCLQTNLPSLENLWVGDRQTSRIMWWVGHFLLMTPMMDPILPVSTVRQKVADSPESEIHLCWLQKHILSFTVKTLVSTYSKEFEFYGVKHKIVFLNNLKLIQTHTCTQTHHLLSLFRIQKNKRTMSYFSDWQRIKAWVVSKKV